MSELAKAFEPQAIEGNCYKFWEEGGFFRADATSQKPSYCIVIPPPNVTGVLHMGHALVDTLQDVLVRWKRMSGYETLWVPGTDHAGIATQTVVERDLMAKTGKRRKDFSREEFLGHVWKWKEESEGNILNQLKRLGCSCDWSRLCFTMDEPRNLAVRTMFKKMFDAGLIYRGDYLVNWDPVTQTALADDEVEYEEKPSFLWYFKYPIENSAEFITVATTRPETMLGDTAIAVSASDERYRHLIGQNVILPIQNRPIPIIADHHVDALFGTGAVKVTPAHDPNDYEIGQRHNLPMINIMTPDGKINENGGEFCGLAMEEGRAAVAAKMKELGLLARQEPHTHRVGVSYRSKAIIEPYLSKQWFVKMTSFKPKLRAAVEGKRVKLLPPHWDHTYFHWIDNLRDWCISRQLWWGHRIPIWYRKDNPDEMVCGEEPADLENWVQDEDVLDTWFSSALWPFSTLGWPNDTPDLKKFYPTSTLVTGHDILFFWVARMILMGEYALDAPPFHETFLHGLIYGKSYWRYSKDGSIAYISGKERLSYDLGTPVPAEIHSKWEKMSKSKGNILDPIEIIDTYGTDALRMALCASATHARQIDLDRRRFEEFKNFANKIWNGARFVLMNLEGLASIELNTELLTLEDRWILSLLNRTIQEVDNDLATYAFDKAATRAYEFFWKDYCAYYLELTKPVFFGKTGTPADKENKQKILLIVLCNALRLMHPMAPFITEELFQELKKRFAHLPAATNPYSKETLQALQAPACMVAPFPKVIQASDIDIDIENTFAFMDSLVHVVRNIRAEMQVAPGIATDLYITGDDLTLVENNQAILRALVRLNTVSFEKHEPAIEFGSSALVGALKLTIPLPQEMREKEKVRLIKEKEKLINEQNNLRTQLSNQEFLQKAPPQLVEKLRASLAQSEKGLSEALAKLEVL